MATDPAPDDIVRFADERAQARRVSDWATADRLKAAIEAAGWKVVDTGTLYDLVRAVPAVVEVDGEVAYGSSAAVPSRLNEPATGRGTVVLVATDHPADLQRAIDGLRAGSLGAQLVVVANGPSDAQASALASLPGGVEVVRLATRLGAAAALNAGIRRAAGEVVVVLADHVEPVGDLVGALAAALDDPSVAVAGPRGLVSADLRHFSPADPNDVDVDAIDGLAIAFRREDYRARGPLDEHFTTGDYLDTWWSLVLRDVVEDADVDATPRRAVQVAVPMTVHERAASPGNERVVRKQLYRFLKSFATRRDLLGGRRG